MIEIHFFIATIDDNRICVYFVVRENMSDLKVIWNKQHDEYYRV